MKDKALIYTIGISVLLHLAAAGVIGRTSGRLTTASVIPTPQLINVDLIGAPDETPEPPEPIVREADPVPERKPEMEPEPTRVPDVDRRVPDRPRPVKAPANRVEPPAANPVTRPIDRRTRVEPEGRPGGSGNQAPGNPGGKIDVGSTSANGDLGGNLSGGKTRVGWVPGGERGEGRGSGNSAGEGRPEPVKNAVDGPNERPAPPPPPAPKIVSVRTCSVSGLLPNEHCAKTRAESFVEGKQPSRHCDRCKAPEPEHRSRLADRANPELVRDSKVSIPSSVDEGLSLSVQVEYTVTASGDVTGVQVTRSSGVNAVDKACVSAASGLKYKPAVQDGIARSVKMSRTYRINT